MPTAAAMAAVLCAGLGGCGGSATTHTASKDSAVTSKYGPKSSPASLSRCMRANGITNFPDPENVGGTEGMPMMSSGNGVLTVEGISFSGPAFQAAEKKCAIYLPPAGPPPQPSPQRKKQMLELARCIRKHGVPNFADPTFNLNQGNGTGVAGKQQVQASPALQRALKACGFGGGNGAASAETAG